MKSTPLYLLLLLISLTSSKSNEVPYVALSEKISYKIIPGLYFEELEKFAERVALQHALDRQKEK